MLRGELCIADDPDLASEYARAQELLERYNRTLHAEQDVRDAILRELIGDLGEGAVVTRDLPLGVVAAGVPARVIRPIGDRDRIELPER